jgi:TniQ
VVLVPAELPFAPRPYVAELLSSWLLRVAAANLVSLHELLEGFEERYGPILSNVPIDYAVPDSAVAALAQFCRIVPQKIRTLDLRQRVPHLSPALLLRYPQNVSLWWCPRCSWRRVRYAFCPLCLASQRVIHVRWDWSVACLIRCAIHRVPLLDNCSACGELDPLALSGFDSSPAPFCRSCGGELIANPKDLEDVQDGCDIQAVEDAYRGMLLGIAPHPALLSKATDRVFRRFVEDMLQLLTRRLNSDSPWQSTSAVPFSRRDILQIIKALIKNAAPSSDRRVRSKGYSRGLILWATLLKFLPECEGSSLEQLSLRWPASLRRRFVSALYYRAKKCWPYSPYGPSYGRRIERREIAAIYALRVCSRPAQTPVATPFSHDFVSHLATDHP